MGIAAFVVYFYLSSYLPILTDSYLAPWQIFDLTSLPTWAQFILGLLAFEGVLYAWHRTMHTVTPLWLSFHQMHHSAERLDTFGAFWFSPIDMLGFTFIGSLALVLLVGINASAATAILLTTFFFAVFQHSNINTPRWLGYFVQRPESHSYHHAQGVHKHNYADLPIFDILFGTFKNPERHYDTGFYYGASYRVVDMLMWRDLNKPKTNDIQPTMSQGVSQ